MMARAVATTLARGARQVRAPTTPETFTGYPAVLGRYHRPMRAGWIDAVRVICQVFERDPAAVLRKHAWLRAFRHGGN